ncbi:hypothetical protein F2Q68_00007067 [Brassica cretica]|uniref:Uncharacterized protein n=1 Tax=Brassica cretica TaxID=69181 RepID=A0A8S9L474_BRACR|nr:hypothetical protein F2Q68_00007067 [Brassica cretica]
MTTPSCFLNHMALMSSFVRALLSQTFCPLHLTLSSSLILDQCFPSVVLVMRLDAEALLEGLVFNNVETLRLTARPRTRDSPRSNRRSCDTNLLIFSDQFHDDAYFTDMLQQLSKKVYRLLLVTPTQDINEPESPAWPGLLIDEGAYCFRGT